MDELFQDPCPPPVDHFSEASTRVELTRVELVSPLVEFLCLLPQREQDELVGLPSAEGARARRGRRAKRHFIRTASRVGVGPGSWWSWSGREGL